ncbi:MAG: N-acetyl-gamma-glutamyl-phosphate reductase [Clostridiaceae bacterium]
MIKVAVVGSTGYAGEELVRILFNHPKVELKYLISHSYAGKSFAEIYPNFNKITNIICINIETFLQNKIDDCDVVFAALPHGLSEDLAYECYKKNILFIDIGADFRLENQEDYKTWYGKEYKYPEIHKDSQYGLCEIHGANIKDKKIIANPGCYPTSIILGLYPALKNKLIDSKSIIIDSKSGITGAGRELSLGAHYAECNESIKAYKVGSHRHTPEIEQELSKAFGENIKISFTPHLVPMNRGILSTIYCNLTKELDTNDILEIYGEFYKDKKFVRILKENTFPEVRNVRGSNYCEIGLVVDKRVNRLVIVSVIDNMVKGAAGQAVQNMNIVLGLEEDLGLNLIPTIF